MKKYKIIFFLTAFSQIISSFFTNFSGGSNFNELLITPAGYTFAIWGAITVASTIYSFWHLFFDRHYFTKNFYILMSSVYVCFTLWLLAAERTLLPITVLIILFMYLALMRSFHEAYKDSYRNKWNKILLLGGTGMYLGWVSIAMILNIAILVFSFGFSNQEEIGIYLQMFFVLLATLNAVLVLYRNNYSKVIFATHWWAFVGLLIGLIGRVNTTSLIMFTLICVAGLNIFYFKYRN